MAFLKKNHQDIYEAMSADLRERLPEITDFEQGSVIRSLLETVAFEQAVFYEQLDHVYNSSFVNTAQGINLEKVVEILDVHRNEPDYAIGEVTFYREEDLAEEIIVPIGTQILTEDNPNQTPIRKSYFTIEEAILSPEKDSVNVKVQAETRGKEMETARETLIVLPRPVSGVKAVTNIEAIDFRGRNRETDDELRARSKKTLLSAGRASETSIEQALLSMPKVYDVKVREYEETPGVIDVYVDGLEYENSHALQNRLEEVRAAGIYARLKASEMTDVSGIIKLVPHENVIKDELPKLEKQVTDAIAKYIRSKKMGESISISQLTSEILNIKGIQDLEKYNIVFQAQPLPTEPVAKENGVPDPEKYDVKELLGNDTDGNPVYAVPENTRSISFSEYGRFTPSSLRVAAGDKKLPVQIQIKVHYPNTQSTTAITGKINTKLNTLNFTTTELQDANILTLSSEILTSYQTKLNTYFDTCKSNITERCQMLRIDPLGDEHRKFLDKVKILAELTGSEKPSDTITSFNMDEGELKNEFYSIVSVKQDGSDDTHMGNSIRTALDQLIVKLTEQSLSSFPRIDIQAELVQDLTKDLKGQLDKIQQEVTELNHEISNLQLELISEETTNTKNQKKASIQSKQTQLFAKLKEQDTIQNNISSIADSAEKLLQKWESLLEQKMLTAKDTVLLNNIVSNTGQIADFDLAMRLRTVTFDGKEYYNNPIPISFVEIPSLDYLWVYSKKLRIVGSMKLDLPTTLTDNAKEEIYLKVHEAMSIVLYNQRPEENIVLEDLVSAAKSQVHVLDAKFDKKTLGIMEAQETELRLLNDRTIDEEIPVNYSEKVLLSEKFFSIEG